MRVAVTGAGGLLGHAMGRAGRAAGARVKAWDRRDLDVTDAAAVAAAVRGARPDVVVHLAAWTDVDGAEADPARAESVNAGGTANVAAACAATGARLVYLSTDYVFDGATPEPVSPSATPAPLNAYGRSKAAGEAVVGGSAGPWLIVRTGWVFGSRGANFVDVMRKRARRRAAVTVVDDQQGAPTPARLVAEASLALVASGARGAWHVAAAGVTSWHGVARLIYQACGADPGLVRPCSSAELGRPARRPAWSVLDCRETEARLGARMPAWDLGVLAWLRRREQLGLVRVEAAA